MVTGHGYGTIDTGTWADTTTPVNYYSYYAYWSESKKDSLDERKKPKAWARWFREFLAELLRSPWDEFLAGHQTAFELCVRRVLATARSGIVPLREWKMKNWVQALRTPTWA